MKNIISIAILSFVVFFSACSDNDFEPRFEKSAEERVAEVNKNNVDILSGSEFGWIGYYSSDEKIGAWPVLMNFTDDGWVRIKSDSIELLPLKSFTTEISYNVNTSQTTNLVFESSCIFNIWHALKKEIPNGSGGTTQVPLGGGEFQFVIKSATPNRVVLESLTDKGDFKTPLVLTKASEADWNFDKDATKEMKRVLADGATSTKYFRQVKIDALKYSGQFRVNETYRIVTFDYLEDEEIKQSQHRMSITKTGFVLIDSLKIDDNTKIANFVYNAVNDSYTSTDGGVETKIEYSNVPGIIYFPFVNEWGTKDGEPVDCTLDYSVMNNYAGVVTPEFYDLCKGVRVADGLKSIDFYMNNEKNPSGWPTTISLRYWKNVNPPFGFSNIIVDIPVDVERVENEKVIFKLRDDYRKAYRDDIEHIDMISPDSAEELIKLLTSEEGFYLISQTFYTRYDSIPYSVVILISVANPSYRFVTEYLEFTKAS